MSSLLQQCVALVLRCLTLSSQNEVERDFQRRGQDHRAHLPVPGPVVGADGGGNGVPGVSAFCFPELIARAFRGGLAVAAGVVDGARSAVADARRLWGGAERLK